MNCRSACASATLLTGRAASKTRPAPLAIAVAAGSGQTSSTVYVSNWLPNEMSQTDWSEFSSQWVERNPEVATDPANVSSGTTPVPNATVEKILMGSPDAATAPLIVVVTNDGSTETHYCVNGDATDSSWSWAVYAMPGDATTILDMAFGYFKVGTGGKAGTYVLFQAGDDQPLQLAFTTPIQPVNSETTAYTHYMTPPDGAACIAALPAPTAPHYTNLYFGGDGINSMASNVQTRKQNVATATAHTGRATPR